MIEQLKGALSNKSATIGIIGLGYVGLPLLLRFSESGYPVIGFDVDSRKVDLLNSSESFIEHIPSSSIRMVVDKGATFTDDFKATSLCDCLIICVPTPLNKNREPDLGYVVQTINSLQPYMRSGQLLSLESTTYPGTTEEIIAPRIVESGFKIGIDYFLVYSPEREDPGNQVFSTQSIPKIVGGYSTGCLDVGAEMYGSIIDEIVQVSSPSVAEMTKLLENIHRAVNIGLVNEMKVVADKMGIDIFEVIDAAKTKPFGFTAYYPGPGLGGHCIPIDPFYLTWKAREFGLSTRFIELSGEVNQAMPQYVVAKLIDGLNEFGKAIKGSTILVLGIAYKKNVDDHRESPAFEIIDLIRQKGGEVAYSDPHVPTFPEKRQYHFTLSSIDLSEESVRSFDAVVLVTDHDLFDYDMIRGAARLLVDSRGRYREPEEKVIRA